MRKTVGMRVQRLGCARGFRSTLVHISLTVQTQPFPPNNRKTRKVHRAFGPDQARPSAEKQRASSRGLAISYENKTGPSVRFFFSISGPAPGFAPTGPLQSKGRVEQDPARAAKGFGKQRLDVIHPPIQRAPVCAR